MMTSMLNVNAMQTENQTKNTSTIQQKVIYAFQKASKHNITRFFCVVVNFQTHIVAIIIYALEVHIYLYPHINAIILKTNERTKKVH